MRPATVLLALSLAGSSALAQEDERLSFDRIVEATPFRTRISYSVFRGPKKERLDFPTFYRLVGRDDLAQRYTAWQRTRVSIGAVAVAALVAGVAVGLWPFAVSCEAERRQGAAVFEACRESWARTTLPVHVLTGLGLVFVSSGLGGWASGIDPQPISFDEARALGEAWNQKHGGGVSVSPVVGPGGVGLAGRF